MANPIAANNSALLPDNQFAAASCGGGSCSKSFNYLPTV
ncbi:hypothetical protein VCCP1035_3058 [Vibrio cholerae CP1035(8)]|nr:hypothetical protein VCCP1035_3058 [Vibrio cholerae CP1035(8)]